MWAAVTIRKLTLQEV